MLLNALIVSMSFMNGAAQAAPPARPQAPSAPQAPRAPQAPQAAAVLRVEPPVIELGRVPPSTHHPVSFTVRNISSSPQRIIEAKPSCKCTTFESVAGRVLQPGETLKIEATMDAPGVPGPKDAHIYIVVEGIERPVIAGIKSVVVMPIEADPPYVDIRGGKLRATAKIASLDGKPFRVLTAGGAAPVFADASGKVIGAPSEPQSQYVLVADFNGVATNDIMQYWVVESDRDDCPLVPVQVRHEATGVRFDAGAVRRRWLWSESLVNAGRINAGEPVVVTVEFSRYDLPGPTADLPPGWGRVEQVVSQSELASVELDGVDARGDKTAISVRFTPQANAAGKCIYVPVEVRTPTGPGRFFVVASVRPQSSSTGGAKDESAPTAPKPPVPPVGGTQ